MMLNQPAPQALVPGYFAILQNGQSAEFSSGPIFSGTFGNQFKADCVVLAEMR